MQKNYFIAQESSRYSVRKQDWFFFAFWRFAKKKGFCIWMKMTMTAIVERQRARFYIQKKQKIAKRLKKKLDNSRCVFISKKPYTFRYRIFHEIFEVGIYKEKSIKLWVTWRFYIQKARHFAKTKIICNTFLYTKIRHFAFRNFRWIFEICGGGWHLFIKIQCTCVTLLYTKCLTLCVTF